MVRSDYYDEDLSPSDIFSVILDPSDEAWLGAIQPLPDWLERRGDFEDDPELLPELARRYGDISKLIVLYTDGHVFNMLDYRERPENPPVVYLDLEAGDGSIVTLAPSIEDLFLKPSA